MATSQGTMDYLLDQLASAGPVSSRKMFGEYCLYFAGRPVGLVCDEQLYLKPSEAGKALMREFREGPPFPGARMHLLVTADDWDDARLLQQLVRVTYDALPAPKAPANVRKAQPGTQSAVQKSLGALANLGPKSVQMLKLAGITTPAALRKLGSVAAYAKVKAVAPVASLNLLWALEGALTGEPWQLVAREHRTSLLLALEQTQRDALRRT
jgi:DNA transformation protein and related proteins